MAEGTGIDPRAVVHETAKLGQDVFIGPFCVVGAGVSIGDRCRLESHVSVDGPTARGPDNVISPMASVGGPPQDLKYDGEPTRLVIGSGNKIREFVTISRGTVGGGDVTTVGDDNLFMTQAHVAHDCIVGNRIVFANGATLAGHVEVGDDSTVGAYSGVHQYCRVARHAFIGGYSVVTQDALPYVLTVGNRAKSFGLNSIGLKRKGFSRETIDAIKSCYTRLFRSNSRLQDALKEVEAERGDVPEVRYFLEFVRTSKRGVCR